MKISVMLINCRLLVSYFLFFFSAHALSCLRWFIKWTSRYVRLTRAELSKGFPIFFMATVRLAFESCAELILTVSGFTVRREYTWGDIPDHSKGTHTSCLQVCIPLGSLKSSAHDLMRDERSHDSKGAYVEEGLNWQNSRRILDPRYT